MRPTPATVGQPDSRNEQDRAVSGQELVFRRLILLEAMSRGYCQQHRRSFEQIQPVSGWKAEYLTKSGRKLEGVCGGGRPSGLWWSPCRATALFEYWLDNKTGALSGWRMTKAPGAPLVGRAECDPCLTTEEEKACY